MSSGLPVSLLIQSCDLTPSVRRLMQSHFPVRVLNMMNTWNAACTERQENSTAYKNWNKDTVVNE